MDEIKINFFPIDECKKAHILRFRFTNGLYNNVIATAIYLRPLTNNTVDIDDLDEIIINAIESEFGQVTHKAIDYVYSVEGRKNVLDLFAQGGATIEFVIEFLPRFELGELSDNASRSISIPQLHFNLKLMANQKKVAGSYDDWGFHIISAELPITQYEDYLQRIAEITTV